MVARSRRCPASSIIRSRLAGPSRRTRCARPPRAGPAPPRRPGGGAKVCGQPVPFLAQPGAVGFQGADPGSSVFPDGVRQLRGVGAGLLELGRSPSACRSAQARSSSRSRAASIESLGDGLPGVGAHPVKFAAHLGLGGTRPFRLAAGLPPPGRQHARRPHPAGRWPR